MTLFLHVARRALLAFLAALAAVVGLFLVVDFAENASAYHGPGWVGAVLLLYAHRAAVVGYETAPAAMLLAAAVTASDLRRTREYTALRALGLGPWRVAGPVLAVAAAAALGLAWLGDAVVVDATARADEIMATRFHRAAALQRAERKRWFRGRGGRIYHLRGGGEGGRFERVTVLEVTPEFRLSRRIDAARMAPDAEEPGAWVLEEVAERRFAPDGAVDADFAPRRTYRFDEDPDAFAVRPGRPAQLRRAVLGAQVALRRRLGLPTQEFALEWNGRLAHPLAAVPASLVALAVALRRERRGHLTLAVVESVGVSLLFWAVQGVCWSLGLAGRLSPALAGWTPDALFLVAGLLALRRYA